MEEVLSFCIEEGYNCSDGWCINAHIDIVKDKIKELKTKISMIPGGITRHLQPLDESINKPLKDELKKRYTKYCTDQKDIKARVTQKDLINWVGEIWYDDKLTSEMVRKSFKTTWITLELDGNEVKMFIGHNSLLKDDQVMVEQVEQPADKQDEGMKMQKLMIITITRRKRQ